MADNVTKTFDDYSRDVAASFLQTVVVLDDEAYIQRADASNTNEEGVARLVEPDPRAPDPPADGNAPDQSRPPAVGHELDAKLLIDTFASKGVICAVLAPAVGENLATHTIRTARGADIVVLDWQIGRDDGVAATAILKGVLKDDKSQGGRLRLLVIYTGENNLRTKCFDPLQASIPGLTPVTGHAMALQIDDARIIFIKKGGGGTGRPEGELAEKELPEKLIAEFASMSQGLLTNAAMASVSAMRNGTHRVLARFHNRLDGPYLAHRILLKTPEDAEQFAIDLVSDEIRQFLESEHVGRSVANIEVLKAYVTKAERDPNVFRIKKTRKPESAEMQAVTPEEIITCLDKGIGGVPWDGKSHLHKRIHPLLGGDAGDCLARHYEFSRLSCFRREAFGSHPPPEGWIPRLELGTVVCTADGEFFVCLQPLCSCIRLKKDTKSPFLFAELSKNVEKFDIVARGISGSDVCLRFEEEPFTTHVWHFDPGQEQEIRASVVNEKLSFKCQIRTVGTGQVAGAGPSGTPSAPQQAVPEQRAAPPAAQPETGQPPVASAPPGAASTATVRWMESPLIWIGELRIPFAMRFVHRISAQLSRVGLDEFEWQRKHATEKED